MVKTPRTRHSNTEREPMTIELGPDEVSRVAAEADETGTAAPTDEAPTEKIDASQSATASSGTSDDVPAGEPPSERPDAGFEDETKLDREAASAARAAAEPQRSAQPQRPSRGSALGAGLAGGVVALAAAGLLQYAGVLGAPNSGGSQAPAISAAAESAIANLRSEIEALKTEVPTDTSGVAGQVDGLVQALDQIKAEVASLKQSVASGNEGQGVDLAPLNAKIAEIDNRIAEIGPGADAATPEEIAAINERIAGVEALAKAATDAGSTTDSRLGALEQSIASLTAKVDAQAGQPKIALAIAASALKSAIERGSAFEPEIETFAAIAPDAPGLAELRTHAQNGVATRAEIIAETDAAAKAMIAAANPPPGDDGFFERLLSSAESMVTVRPVGDVEGPGVPETVARMEVAIQGGDLAKAISEFDTLPERSRAAGAAFADRIKARLTVEQLADQAIATAMQAS
jgi:hypothetical protein